MYSDTEIMKFDFHIKNKSRRIIIYKTHVKNIFLGRNDIMYDEPLQLNSGLRLNMIIKFVLRCYSNSENNEKLIS